MLEEVPLLNLVQVEQAQGEKELKARGLNLMLTVMLHLLKGYDTMY